MDFITRPEDLPVLNRGVSELKFLEVAPSRNVVGDNFKNGQIIFPFDISDTTTFIPEKCFVKTRYKLKGRDGAGTTRDLEMADDLAPSMSPTACSLQSCEMRLAGKTISKIDNNVAQVDALTKRLYKSKGWMDSMGKELEMWDSNQSIRALKYSVDAAESQSVSFIGLPREQLGFDAPAANNSNQIRVILADGGRYGTLRFIQNGGAALPDVREVFKKGDVCRYLGKDYIVTGFENNAIDLSVYLAGELVADVAAASNVQWYRVARGEKRSTRNKNGFTCIWQPPLSIFEQKRMASGKYELVLNPDTQYMTRAVESSTVEKIAVRDGQIQVNGFTLDVIDMYFYVCVVDSVPIENLTYYLSLDQINCNVQSFTSSTALIRKNFNVSPTTEAITVAFQDQKSGVSTRYSPTKFKIRKITGNQDYDSGELALKQIYVQYGNQVKPSPALDIEYKGRDDYMSELYAQTQYYSPLSMVSGGTEDKEDFLERGLFFHQLFPKDGRSEADTLSVSFQFGAAPDADSGNLLLFSHEKNIVRITIEDGRVTDVFMAPQ